MDDVLVHWAQRAEFAKIFRVRIVRKCTYGFDLVNGSAANRRTGSHRKVIGLANQTSTGRVASVVRMCATGRLYAILSTIRRRSGIRAGGVLRSGLESRHPEHTEGHHLEHAGNNCGNVCLGRFIRDGARSRARCAV